MVADRIYWPDLLASPDRRASLLYFAAAVPTVGFVHRAADLSPLNAAALEGRFIRRAPRTDTAACGAMPNHVAAVLKAVASGSAMACLRLVGLGRGS
jgi:hypothetical protein